MNESHVQCCGVYSLANMSRLGIASCTVGDSELEVAKLKGIERARGDALARVRPEETAAAPGSKRRTCWRQLSQASERMAKGLLLAATSNWLCGPYSTDPGLDSGDFFFERRLED